MNQNTSAPSHSVILHLLAILLLTTLTASSKDSLASTGEEMSAKNQWLKQNLLNRDKIQPFSFTCGGQPSSSLLPSWKRTEIRSTLDAHRTQRVITWSHDGLQVKCVTVDYDDYPATEWTVYIKNIGATNTPVLQDIQGLDSTFTRTPESEFILNGIKGDWTVPDSYKPYQITLPTNEVKTFCPPSNSGKSTDGPDGWPYFNLQMPGGGILLAVGWPGEWETKFTRDASNRLRIRAGQQLTHLYLKPGEEIRTPLIVLVFWQGTDVIRAQNLWRRWYMVHNIPHFDGKPQSTMTSLQVSGADGDIAFVKSYLDAGIKPDLCWRDAFGGGFTWYPSDTGPNKDKGADVFGKFAWLNTGTWDVDKRALPQGFRPLSDWLHAHNMQFMLWFEPERVGDTNSWIGKNHPEWLLPATESTVGAILNEGHPTARDWLINHVDAMVKTEGLDWYREDMNGCGPLTAWRKADAEDRQGITENFYVQGHLAFWDELKRRHPRLHIDSCASGGRRNDLETMRRAVPVTRSDFLLPNAPEVVEGNQGHTYGLSMWLPWHGSEDWFTDTYSSRSFYLPGFQITGFSDYMETSTRIPEQNVAAIKKAYSECAEIAPMMLGDYYPLTPYNRELDQWLAWQFNRPDKGDGVIQVFRRKNCSSNQITLKLQGLEPKAIYEIKDFDGGISAQAGKALMTEGLTVNAAEAPCAALLTYKKSRK